MTIMFKRHGLQDFRQERLKSSGVASAKMGEEAKFLILGEQQYFV